MSSSLLWVVLLSGLRGLDKLFWFGYTVEQGGGIMIPKSKFPLLNPSALT